MNTQDESLLANRVNTEPPIFRGCSSSELLAMLVGSILIWLPLSLLVALIIGRVTLFLGILAIGVLGSMYFGAGVFNRLKRNRPDYYYVHAFKRFLHDHGLHRARFIWRSGSWDIGRRSLP